MADSSTGNPYIDIITENKHIRKFAYTINENELVWHRDKQDRSIKIVNGEDWFLQFDDDLPFLLEKEKEYSVPKMKFHRLIKGKTDLIIEINSLI